MKERNGKRPLLAGELNVIMRDGIAPIGDIEFTDNSCWIRCRKFRVAVRVAPGTNQGGVRIREAISEAFAVKDHRGECKLYAYMWLPSPYAYMCILFVAFLFCCYWFFLH